jgi:hypothetical protein
VEVLTEKGKRANLLRESFAGGIELRLLEGDAKAPGTLGTVSLTAAEADIVNENRRFYSRTVFLLATERAQTLVKEGRFLGEVDHPWMGTLERAAFRFTKLYMDGAYQKGEGVILDTPGGRALKGLLDGGVGVRVSTRGYGSYTIETREVNGEKTEVAVIGEDFQLEGIDFVLFPSNPAGRVDAHESVTHMKESMVMTVEQLRSEHPELVAEIEAAARAGFIAQEAHETAVAEAREQVRTETLESAEVAQLRTAIASVKEALTPFLPVVEQVEQAQEVSAAQEEAHALTAQVNALTEQVRVLTEERQAAESARQEAERVAAEEAQRNTIREHVQAVLADFPQRALVEEALLACESVEAVDALFIEKKGFIEQVRATALVGQSAGTGTGQAESVVPPTAEQTPADVEKLRERKLAGIES